MYKSLMISPLRRTKDDELETRYEEQDQSLFRLDSLLQSAVGEALLPVNGKASDAAQPDGSPAANA